MGVDHGGWDGGPWDGGSILCYVARFALGYFFSSKVPIVYWANYLICALNTSFLSTVKMKKLTLFDFSRKLEFIVKRAAFIFIFFKNKCLKTWLIQILDTGRASGFETQILNSSLNHLMPKHGLLLAIKNAPG